MFGFKEYTTPGGLRWSTNYPEGSPGFRLEWEFMHLVCKNREMGFGRMNQMVEHAWNQVLVAQGLPPNPSPADEGLIEQASRWWVSWYEPTNKKGEYAMPDPLPKGVHVWCSGSTDDAVMLCAMVDAPTEEAVKTLIKKHWKPTHWRFCKGQAKDWTPGERFPMPG